MGAVFLAYDTTLHRQVALKVLLGAAGDESARARILREARNAAALNHPNICTVYEVGEAGGRAFIAMEYIEGRPLSDRLSESPLPLSEAMRYAIEAADAVAYAHDHGVVHRDLKAANAIVTTWFTSSKAAKSRSLARWKRLSRTIPLTRPLSDGLSSITISMEITIKPSS